MDCKPRTSAIECVWTVAALPFNVDCSPMTFAIGVRIGNRRSELLDICIRNCFTDKRRIVADKLTILNGALMRVKLGCVDRLPFALFCAETRHVVAGWID